MEKGLVFALFSALGFGISSVSVRRGVSRAGESFTATVISIFIGVPFFAASAFFSGELNKLWSLSGQAIILLAAAGLIHFIGGRLFAYNSYRLIGLNKASIFIRTSPIYTVVLGVFFLNESLTISLVVGVLFIFAGMVFVSTERKGVGVEKTSGTQIRRRLSSTEVKGILAGLGAGLCWGISPILIKPAVEEVGSPSVAALISYTAASIVIACFFFRRQHRKQMLQLNVPATIILLLVNGIFVCIAHLFNYTALSYSPASMVTPLVQTHALFALFFSFFVNRNIEIFTPKIILGIIAAVVGAFLIFYS